MTIFPNDLIVLRDAISRHQLASGTLGRVRREVGPDEYEVEFVNERGKTAALVHLTPAQFSVPRHDSKMTEADFWHIIETTKAHHGSNPQAQADVLITQLAAMPLPELLAFGDIAERLHDDAYRWELWAACFIIGNLGCSDDGFYDFREWLIEQGQAIYYHALADPESLVDHMPLVQSEFGAFTFGSWEQYGITHVSWDAYKIQTGREFPIFAGIHPLPQITGERWDERTVHLKYPKLAAKFMSR